MTEIKPTPEVDLRNVQTTSEFVSGQVWAVEFPYIYANPWPGIGGTLRIRLGDDPEDYIDTVVCGRYVSSAQGSGSVLVHRYEVVVQSNPLQRLFDFYYGDRPGPVAPPATFTTVLTPKADREPSQLELAVDTVETGR